MQAKQVGVKATPEARHDQNRTAIVYFGPNKEDYLKLLQAEDRSEYIAYIQNPLQAQLSEVRPCSCLFRLSGSLYAVLG
jgi:hypothetical protein